MLKNSLRAARDGAVSLDEIINGAASTEAAPNFYIVLPSLTTIAVGAIFEAGAVCTA